MKVTELADDGLYMVITCLPLRESWFVRGRSLKKLWMSSKVQHVGAFTPVLPGYTLIECEVKDAPSKFVCVKSIEAPPLTDDFCTKHLSFDMRAAQSKETTIIPLPQPKPRRKALKESINDEPKLKPEPEPGPESRLSWISDFKTAASILIDLLSTNGRNAHQT